MLLTAETSLHGLYSSQQKHGHACHSNTPVPGNNFWLRVLLLGRHNCNWFCLTVSEVYSIILIVGNGIMHENLELWESRVLHIDLKAARKRLEFHTGQRLSIGSNKVYLHSDKVGHTPPIRPYLWRAPWPVAKNSNTRIYVGQRYSNYHKGTGKKCKSKGKIHLQEKDIFLMQ